MIRTSFIFTNFTNIKLTNADYLLNRTYIVGRSDKAEINIQEDSISRKHAEICILSDSATIKDLASGNFFCLFMKKNSWIISVI